MEDIKNPIGRPSDYTKEIADQICNELSEGKSLRKVCESGGMPSKVTIFAWMRKYPEFLNQYARAKEESADAMNEDLMDLGDEAINHAYNANPKASSAVVQAVKLKADNLKWVMSKMKPKKYGDKTDITSNGESIVTVIKYEKGDSATL